MADKFPEYPKKTPPAEGEPLNVRGEYPKKPHVAPPAEGEPLNVRGGTYPHVKGDPLNPRPGHGPKVDPKPEIAPPWAYPQDGDPDVAEFEPGVDALLPFRKDADPDDPRYPQCDPNNSSRPNPIDPNPPTDDERKRDPNKRFYAKHVRDPQDRVRSEKELRDRTLRDPQDRTLRNPQDKLLNEKELRDKKFRDPDFTADTNPTEPYFPR